MSSSFLNAASTRSDDSSPGGNPHRQKVTQLSEKVVDSNPYSRLMYAHAL